MSSILGLLQAKTASDARKDLYDYHRLTVYIAEQRLRRAQETIRIFFSGSAETSKASEQFSIRLQRAVYSGRRVASEITTYIRRVFEHNSSDNKAQATWRSYTVITLFSYNTGPLLHTWQNPCTCTKVKRLLQVFHQALFSWVSLLKTD